MSSAAHYGVAVTLNGMVELCAAAAGVPANIVNYDPAAVEGVEVKKAFPFRPIHFYSYPAKALEARREGDPRVTFVHHHSPSSLTLIIITRSPILSIPCTRCCARHSGGKKKEIPQKETSVRKARVKKSVCRVC